MTNAELIQKIRAEIERRKEDAYNSILPDEPKYRTHYKVGKKELCEELLSFLSTLEEKSEIPKDLEEAVEKQIDEALFKWSYDDEDGIEQYVHDAFIAGAKWQKEQMMNEAVEGEVENASFGIVYLRKNLANEGYSTGDKVRVIIVKED